MSCKLYYKWVSQHKHSVGNHELRDILENRYGLPVKLDAHNYNYLEGLRDAKIEGAQDLLDAIAEYKLIEIFKEC
jgi:hypothetical protein